jgi:hypothetical protein
MRCGGQSLLHNDVCVVELTDLYRVLVPVPVCSPIFSAHRILMGTYFLEVSTTTNSWLEAAVSLNFEVMHVDGTRS